LTLFEKLLARTALALLSWVALNAAATTAAAPPQAASLAPARAATYAADIAPLLAAHCQICHRDGSTWHTLPLDTYAAVRRAADAIKREVSTGQMPPWPADPERSMPFRNDARLSARDIDTLVGWVDAGAPQGAIDAPPGRADGPPSRRESSVWEHPQGTPPDVVLTLPPVFISASGEIPYVQQRVKVPLTHDQWIAAMQVNPGNVRAVHHMGITEVAVPDGVTAQDLDELQRVARKMGVADDALQRMRPAVVDPVNAGAYDMLGVYTPGSGFEMYPPDSGKLLKGGSNLYINFNIHYQTTGQPEQSASQLALWFEPKPPRHQVLRAPAAVATLIANGRELFTDDPGTKAEGTVFAIPPIAAYQSNYELIGMTAFVTPVTLYQLQPHAHMRGKDFTYSVIYPDGHEALVLTVPHYDWHWQLAYELATPLQLPAGAKLVVKAHYDNSSANPHLSEASVDRERCGPDREAYFLRQNQSWHEMFSPLVQYAVDGSVHSAGALHIVQVVGCLDAAQHEAGAPAAGAPPAWALRQAGAALRAATGSTSRHAVAESANSPLGAQCYDLIGADPFEPQHAAGRKVVVKGVLVGGHASINVTSLQVLGACQSTRR